MTPGQEPRHSRPPPAGELAPVHVLSSDEPLLLQEAADALRAAARAQGYSEREILFAEPGFDWNMLAARSHSMSLFAARRLIELRMPSPRPGEAGARALGEYAAAPPQDTLLLVLVPRLDAKARASKWYRALERAGSARQLWPPTPRELPGWIAGRGRSRGLELSDEATALLAQRTEGNLLAAAQEIDKLALLATGGRVDAALVMAAVGDSARYDLFGMVDAALAGDAARALRMLEGLRGEGTEPPLILWALVRELRTLEQVAWRSARGASADRVLGEMRVWRWRVPVMRKALARYDVAAWRELLQAAARIDTVIKGVREGDPWTEMVQLLASVAGLLPPARVSAAAEP